MIQLGKKLYMLNLIHICQNYLGKMKNLSRFISTPGIINCSSGIFKLKFETPTQLGSNPMVTFILRLFISFNMRRSDLFGQGINF